MAETHTEESPLKRAAAWLGARGPEFRLSFRMTIAGLLAYAVAYALALPQGYWTIFTAVIVMQASLGASFKAALDRFVGTLAGTVYGLAVVVAVPHAPPIGEAVAIVIAIAPLAFLAAMNASFRVAPVTAVILLVGPGGTHLPPLEAGLDRVIEIGLGSVIGFAVALFVLPARAHAALVAAAADVVEREDALLAALLRGTGGAIDAADLRRRHDAIAGAMRRLDAAAEEARRERKNHLADHADPEPLVRTCRRLRHDLVMIGRATAQPLPAPVYARLAPHLDAIATAVGGYLAETARQLRARGVRPGPAAADAACEALGGEIERLRAEHLMRGLPSEAVERVYTLAFALEQMRQHLRDLGDRAQEFASGSA